MSADCFRGGPTEQEEQAIFGAPAGDNDHDILIRVVEAQRWTWEGIKEIKEHLKKSNGIILTHERRISNSETKWKALCGVVCALIAGVVPSLLWAFDAL